MTDLKSAESQLSLEKKIKLKAFLEHFLHRFENLHENTPKMSTVVSRRVYIYERIYFKRDFCQQAPLKIKIDTSRSRMMIIFEMEQLWCLVNTFQNFGQHVLTNC